MNTRKKRKSIIMIGVATAILVMGVGLGFYLNAPVNMVAIDINPSLELHTNSLGYVVSVDPVNEDAVQLMAGYKLEDRDLESVIEDIVDRLILSGYLLAGQENQILVSADESISANELLNKVNENISTYAQSKQLMVEVLRQSMDINAADVELAHENNISAGKMAIVDKLAESGNSLSAVELAKTSVKDLIQYSIDQNISLEDLIQNYSEVLDNQPAVTEVANAQGNQIDALSSATIKTDTEVAANDLNLSENDITISVSDKDLGDKTVETDAVSSATIKKDADTSDKTVNSSNTSKKITNKSDEVDAVSSATRRTDADAKSNVNTKVKVEKNSDYENEDSEDYDFEDGEDNDYEEAEDYDVEDNEYEDASDEEDADVYYDTAEVDDSEEDSYYSREDREDGEDSDNEYEDRQEENHYEDDED